LYNDDSKIETKDWDLTIIKEPKIVGLNPISDEGDRKKYDLFPIIHRKIYEALGFFSMSPHNDSWIFHLVKTAGLEKKLPELKICHFRNKMKDTTYNERTASLKISVQKHLETLKSEDMVKAMERIEKAKNSDEWV
jgi:hypothetical protein